MIVGKFIFDTFYYFFTVYSISIFTFYILMMLISFTRLDGYLKKSNLVNYTTILSSPFCPSVSVIIPMYNESKNASITLRSTLSIQYPNYDLIVVNDGSKDDTLQNLINDFSLEKVPYNYIEKIKSSEVLGIYKSKNKAFDKLIVVDKENGGKADALNVGINVSNSKYLACIDGDCVLTEDSIVKMIKPFLDETDKKIIASGGVIRVANSCKIKDGKIREINMPKSQVVRFQILEYLRTFLLGRVGWSKYKGLMVISGAFGMLDKEVVLAVNGYEVNTLGEDMDIVVKMQKYMYNIKQEYEVAYIPDPLCWTETPENLKILKRQRNRWAKGTIKTLKDHKDILFKKKYGLLGSFGYPFWFIYERLGPLIELSGIVYFLVASWLGYVNWIYTISFLIATYLFAILFSLYAIYAEEISYHQYRKKGDLRKLITTILIEPFTYHVFLLMPNLKANFEFLFSLNNKWGNMERKGLATKE